MTSGPTPTMAGTFAAARTLPPVFLLSSTPSATCSMADAFTSTKTPGMKANACFIFAVTCCSYATALARPGSAVTNSESDTSGPSKTCPLRRSVSATCSTRSPAIEEATSTRIACTRCRSNSSSESVRTLTLAVSSSTFALRNRPSELLPEQSTEACSIPGIDRITSDNSS